MRREDLSSYWLELWNYISRLRAVGGYAPAAPRRRCHGSDEVEWLRRMVATGEVVIFACPTEHQIADMLTKCQGRVLFLSQRGQALGYVLWVPPSSTPDVHRFDNADGITDDGGAEEEKA